MSTPALPGGFVMDGAPQTQTGNDLPPGFVEDNPSAQPQAQAAQPPAPQPSGGLFSADEIAAAGQSTPPPQPFHYPDEIGPDNKPGAAAGDYENSIPAGTFTGNLKGAAKAAISDLLSAGQALTPSFMVSNANRQEAKNLQQKLQPQGTAEQVGATTERAATTAATAAGLPEVLEGVAGLVRGGKLAESDAGEVLNRLFGGSSKDEPQPGTIQKIVKGEGVAQPGAKAAVRSAVKSAADEGETAVPVNDSAPLLSGNKTIVDDQLRALATKEKALYKRVDDTVGFDLKAEKEQLANDQYKLSQLGNTDVDITARGNLTEAINDSQDRIAAAEKQLQDAGIDPKAADAVHQARMAGQDFKKALVSATSPDGESVNVDKLLNASKQLRFSKYGDRLSQFMGKQGADNFVSQLQKMQSLGAHAVKVQRVAKWVTALTLPEAVAGGSYAVLKK